MVRSSGSRPMGLFERQKSCAGLCLRQAGCDLPLPGKRKCQGDFCSYWKGESCLGVSRLAQFAFSLVSLCNWQELSFLLEINYLWHEHFEFLLKKQVLIFNKSIVEFIRSDH